MSLTVEELVTIWGFDVDPTNELGKMKKGLTDIRNGLNKLGAVATAALAATIIPAANLEQALADTMTMTGATGAEFDRLHAGMSKKAKDLSEQLGVSATEINTSFYQVLSTGAKPLSDEFNSLSEVGIKLAKTVGLDASNAIEDLNSTLNASGKSLTFTGKLADMLFQSSKLVATNVPQMMEALKTAAPVAVNFGMELQDTIAILSGLAQAGFKGGEAGNSLRRILIRLIDPPAEAKKAFEALGMTLTDSTGKYRPVLDILEELKAKTDGLNQSQRATVIAQIAGTYAVSQFSNLLNGNISDLRKWRGSLVDSAGALDVAFDQKMNTAIEQTKRLWISVKNLAATFGEPLLKPLTGSVEAFSDLTVAVRGFADEHPTLMETISIAGGITLALIAASSALGSVTISVTLAKMAFAAMGREALIANLKIIAIPLAVGAAALALGFLLDDLIAFFQGSDSLIGKMLDGYDEWGAVLAGLATSVAVIGSVMLASLSPVLATVVALVVTTIALARAWDEITSKIDAYNEKMIQNDRRAGKTEERGFFSWAGGLFSSFSQDYDPNKWFNPQLRSRAREQGVPFDTFEIPTEAKLRARLGAGANVTINHGDTIIQESGNPEETRRIVREERDRDLDDVSSALFPEVP